MRRRRRASNWPGRPLDDPDPERQNLLRQLEETHRRLLDLLERDSFARGFRLGGQLVAEVFR